MTPKEYRAFARALKNVDIINVRECADPAFEPDAIKRDIAITELARRGQAIEFKNIYVSKFVRPISWIIVAIIVAGIVVWKFS